MAGKRKSQRPCNSRRAQFMNDRFGMFIHWGIYSLPSRGEWVLSNEELSLDDYRRYLLYFEPDLYDPKDWARRARSAGMRHMVMTAKHHDGFCLWPTAETDFSVANTPYGKDLIEPFVDACRSEGLAVGIYFSLIDWHHPDFSIDIFHPRRNDPKAADINAQCDVARYQAFMKAQVTELLSQYGDIDMLFMDFSYPSQTYNGLPGKGREYWDSEGLMQLVRKLQPNVMVNNRLDLLDHEADFYTPECFVPDSPPKRDGKPVIWEAAFTMSESWGYQRDEDTFKSPEQLIQVLINMVSLGGNLLMNVGPTGRGCLDDRDLQALHVYTEWMRFHSRSIYGCGPSEIPNPKDCRLTQNGDRVYVHVFNWPYKHLHLKELGGKVKYAQLLNDASEVKWLPPGTRVTGEGEGLQGLDADDPPESTLILTLPVKKPDTPVPVIELILD